MLRRNRAPRERVDRARLALRDIEGNLAFTDHEAWAWFLLPTQPWAFRSDTQREQLIFGTGEALTWLAGHRIHLRVTSRPYPSAEWARNLDKNSPEALKPAAGASWSDHLVSMQRHLRHQTMAEKEVFLGVRLASRPLTGRIASSVLRRPGLTGVRAARLPDRARHRGRRPARHGRQAGHRAGDGVAAPALARHRTPVAHLVGSAGRRCLGRRGPPLLRRRRRPRRHSLRPLDPRHRPARR